MINSMNSVDRELNIGGGCRAFSSANGYSNADGDLESQLVAQGKVVASAQAAWTSANNEANTYVSTIKEGGYCAKRYSNAGKRRSCQAEVDAEATRLLGVASSKKIVYDGAVTSLNEIKDRIKADDEVRKTLAAQGKTPESVIAETEAVITAKASADSAVSARKKIIIIGGIVIALGIAGFILYKKYNK